MYFAGVIAAIFIAILFTLLLTMAFNTRGPWGSVWSVFLVILLGVWAASLWIGPIGPVYWDIAWLPLLFIGLIFALLLAAATPSAHEQRRFGTRRLDKDPLDHHKQAKNTLAAISVFFWILLVILVLIIIIGYAV